MHGSMTIAFSEPKIPMNSILWISCHLKISQGLPWQSRASEAVLPPQVAQVQSLGGELRSRMLCGGLPRWH